MTAFATPRPARFAACLSRLPDLPWWRGVVTVGVLAYVALTLSQLGWMQRANLGGLTLAMLIGMLVGNTGSTVAAQEMVAGVNFAKGPFLRAAIVLYGFRVTFQDIGEVGLAGAMTARGGRANSDTPISGNSAS